MRSIDRDAARAKRLRTLVLGGAGFLGSHLCERLLDEGQEVIAIDNFVTGTRANVAHLLRSPRFTLVDHDVTQPFHLPADRVFNLACPASPVHYQASPVKTLLTSVLGTLHALELGRLHGARVLLASTSEVYGDPEVHPQPESYRGRVNPIGIRSCYDEGKRSAESLATDYHRTYGTEVRIARIFNTYGPRMAASDGRVVSNFIVQALRGDELTIYGDGSQTRSFCYVDDMIDGLMALMEHATSPGPVNLGNPEEFTVRELADQVLAITGSSSVLVSRPIPEDDPRLRKPDIGRAQRLLGFSPRVRLAEGLERTVRYFQSVAEGEPAVALAAASGRTAHPLAPAKGISRANGGAPPG
jgi:UDP-glucuronate decarboxylase